MKAEDPSSPVELLGRLTFATHARLESRASEAEISIQQFRLLGILRDREPTINELAAHLGTDKSSISGAVARAERRGLVSRMQDQRDGRSVRVRLEPEGRALVDAATAEFEGDVQRMFATLSEAERARWVAITSRLLTAVAGEQADSF
jgi:DNA-binding MarR family transcriptional regulator